MAVNYEMPLAKTLVAVLVTDKYDGAKFARF